MSKSSPPHTPTPKDLEAVAVRYLERFSASAESLRRVLLRRLARAAAESGEPVADGAALVEAVVARLQGLGLLDDRRYAEGRSRSLWRSGKSLRGIRAYLSQRGVGGEVIDEVLAGLAEEDDEPDRAAALAFAKRRRLGPFRPAAARTPNRLRDLASLGRAGFSYEVARAVIDGEAE